MPFSVLTPDQLDYDEYARMQRSAFAALLRDAGVSDAYLNPEYFRWKYHPPAGPGRIALYRDGNDILSANAMFPLVVRSGSQKLIGWQSCDTATVPEARGGGRVKGMPALYLACLMELKKQIKADELFFGYPNANSKRGFERLGWLENAVVPTFVKSALVSAARPHAEVQRVTSFDKSLDGLSENLVIKFGTMLSRDREYLNWRYVKNPVATYEKFLYDENSVPQGLMVLREATVMGRRFVLVMELWGLTRHAERALLGTAVRWAREQRIRYLAMIGNYLKSTTALRHGYVSVPSSLLPKRQVLMGVGASPEAAAVMKSEWTIQLGDWDGF